jgi:hypothetical protein
MAATTSFVARRVKCEQSRPQNFRVANGVTIPIGAFVGVADASYATSAYRGYAINWPDAANCDWAGLAINSPFDLSTSNTVVGDTTASVPPEVSVETGNWILQKATVTNVAAQTDVGDLVYATDNNTLDTSAGTANAVGKVRYWHSSTTADVEMFSMIEWVNVD